MVVMFSGLIVHLAIFYYVMSAGHKARLRRMGMSLLAKYWTNRPDHSTGQKVWRVITIHPVGGGCVNVRTKLNGIHQLSVWIIRLHHKVTVALD